MGGRNIVTRPSAKEARRPRPGKAKIMEVLDSDTSAKSNGFTPAMRRLLHRILENDTTRVIRNDPQRLAKAFAKAAEIKGVSNAHLVDLERERDAWVTHSFNGGSEPTFDRKWPRRRLTALTGLVTRGKTTDEIILFLNGKRFSGLEPVTKNDVEKQLGINPPEKAAELEKDPDPEPIVVERDWPSRDLNILMRLKRENPNAGYETLAKLFMRHKDFGAAPVTAADIKLLYDKTNARKQAEQRAAGANSGNGEDELDAWEEFVEQHLEGLCFHPGVNGNIDILIRLIEQHPECGFKVTKPMVLATLRDLEVLDDFIGASEGSGDLLEVDLVDFVEPRNPRSREVLDRFELSARKKQRAKTENKKTSRTKTPEPRTNRKKKPKLAFDGPKKKQPRIPWRTMPDIVDEIVYLIDGGKRPSAVAAHMMKHHADRFPPGTVLTSQRVKQLWNYEKSGKLRKTVPWSIVDGLEEALISKARKAIPHKKIAAELTDEFGDELRELRHAGVITFREVSVAIDARRDVIPRKEFHWTKHSDILKRLVELGNDKELSGHNIAATLNAEFGHEDPKKDVLQGYRFKGENVQKKLKRLGVERRDERIAIAADKSRLREHDTQQVSLDAKEVHSGELLTETVLTHSVTGGSRKRFSWSKHPDIEKRLIKLATTSTSTHAAIAQTLNAEFGDDNPEKDLLQGYRFTRRSVRGRIYDLGLCRPDISESEELHQSAKSKQSSNPKAPRKTIPWKRIPGLEAALMKMAMERKTSREIAAELNRRFGKVLGERGYHKPITPRQVEKARYNRRNNLPTRDNLQLHKHPDMRDRLVELANNENLTNAQVADRLNKEFGHKLGNYKFRAATVRVKARAFGANVDGRIEENRRRAGYIYLEDIPGLEERFLELVSDSSLAPKQIAETLNQEFGAPEDRLMGLRFTESSVHSIISRRGLRTTKPRQGKNISWTPEMLQIAREAQDEGKDNKQIAVILNREFGHLFHGVIIDYLRVQRGLRRYKDTELEPLKEHKQIPWAKIPDIVDLILDDVYAGEQYPDIASKFAETYRRRLRGLTVNRGHVKWLMRNYGDKSRLPERQIPWETIPGLVGELLTAVYDGEDFSSIGSTLTEKHAKHLGILKIEAHNVKWAIGRFGDPEKVPEKEIDWESTNGLLPLLLTLAKKRTPYADITRTINVKFGDNLPREVTVNAVQKAIERYGAELNISGRQISLVGKPHIQDELVRLRKKGLSWSKVADSLNKRFSVELNGVSFKTKSMPSIYRTIMRKRKANPN